MASPISDTPNAVIVRTIPGPTSSHGADWRKRRPSAIIAPHSAVRRADARTEERQRRHGQDHQREVADAVGDVSEKHVGQDVPDDDPRPPVAEQLERAHEVGVADDGGAGPRQLGVAGPAGQRDRDDHADDARADDRDHAEREDQEREGVDAVDERPIVPRMIRTSVVLASAPTIVPTRSGISTPTSATTMSSCTAAKLRVKMSRPELVGAERVREAGRLQEPATPLTLS